MSMPQATCLATQSIYELPECLFKCRRVDRFAGIFSFHDIEERVRPGQAANMRRLNPAGVLSNGRMKSFLPIGDIVATGDAPSS